MARTLTFQNQIRSTTSGIEFIDDLDLNDALTILDDDELLDDEAQVSGTIIHDLNFIRTALRDIKGDTPTFSWASPIPTTSGLISLTSTRSELSTLQSFIGSIGDGDTTPTYSSTAVISPTADLTEAIGQLDAAVSAISPGSSLEIKRRTLVLKKKSHHHKNDSLDINSPGSDWDVSGDTITIPDSTTFVESVSVFVDGALMYNGENASANRDTYFVSSTPEIAFEFNLHKRAIIQIWEFPTS